MQVLELFSGTESFSKVCRARGHETFTIDNDKKFDYDEWHCGWSRTDVKNMGQVTVNPLDDWSKLDTYEWPDPDDPELYEGMEARFAGREGKYVSTSIFMLLFERMHSLHGFQSTLEDLHIDRNRTQALADRIGLDTEKKHPDVIKNEVFEAKVEDALEGPIFVIDYPFDTAPFDFAQSKQDR